MKKRLLIVIFSAVCMLAGMGKTTAAAQISSDTVKAEAVSLDIQEVTEVGDTELPTGGLKHLQQVEITADELPEIYVEKRNANSRGASIYSSEWDKYSTNYYYNQLNENEKALWDALDAMCLDYMTGTESLSATGTDSGLLYITKRVMYTGLTKSSASTVAMMFKVSNPQYYFLDAWTSNISAGSGGYVALTVLADFANGIARQTATNQMKTVIDSWMVQINAQPTEWAKEKLAHDLICEKVVYDNAYMSSTQNPYNQVAYSVFCTDSTVCAGYSQAMQLLMNAAGIDCAVVTSEEHEWNIIRINGTWYYLDITWDDPTESMAAKIGQNVGYQYFNRSAAQYANDIYGDASMHTVESFWNGYLPELIYDSQADWTNPGTVHTPSAALQQPVIMVDNDKVTITAPSGGNIYYTTDGTYPGIAAAKARKFTGTFTVSGITTVNAVAVANGYYDSVQATAYVTPQYTVNFQANGGYIGKKSVKSGSKQVSCGAQLGKLPSPKKKGYAFLGWYTGKSGGSKITGTTRIAANQTYYAHWAKIQVKKASLTSVKNTAKGTIRVKINNIKTASGYEIRYSLKANMASAKRVKISENAADISKLKKGKTYYIQARMFQKESVSGKKSYGAWSKAKKVKVKK